MMERRLEHLTTVADVVACVADVADAVNQRLGWLSPPLLSFDAEGDFMGDAKLSLSH